VPKDASLKPWEEAATIVHLVRDVWRESAPHVVRFLCGEGRTSWLSEFRTQVSTAKDKG
jgi:hypothetical protein